MFTNKANERITYAHRGARAYAPENTMPAFHKALELGAEAIELDVNLTKDGYAVIFHDFVLTRTTNIAELKHLQKNGEKTGIHHLTLEEVRSLDAGKWYAESDPYEQIKSGTVPAKIAEGFTGTIIPTLDELLFFIKASNMLLNLEIKDQTKIDDNTHTIVHTILEHIQKHGLEERILISSFNHDYLKTIHAEMPEMALGILTEERIENPVEYCKQLNAVAYHPCRTFTTADDIKDLREAGILVNIWTINCEHELYAFANWGANGLISDFPDRAGTAIQLVTSR
ncbi:glycerophosphodiester phosphodiesterase [Halodesulfovibrio marinisediminis]|uniref:Glycerophosphoryl diester phosphodiesterase n=1 Tax=Halodesulfovibrio marinisediminis DSM 17456 TaxID=1121457 RepID=A0A1N6HDB8_9BACT|nr:glycerophosphodiester phosphodiesterase family protein [Halodesulfovibrio marinisediminis]SIO17782.1 glycerophosphoryl diester phosphodiesterase [Halodesulfovibrio marinisediminis DSM 17456]